MRNYKILPLVLAAILVGGWLAHASRDRFYKGAQTISAPRSVSSDAARVSADELGRASDAFVLLAQNSAVPGSVAAADDGEEDAGTPASVDAEGTPAEPDEGEGGDGDSDSLLPDDDDDGGDSDSLLPDGDEDGSDSLLPGTDDGDGESLLPGDGGDGDLFPPGAADGKVKTDSSGAGSDDTPPDPLDDPAATAAAAHTTYLKWLQEEKRFPTAVTCAKCHPDHFAEWSVSAHAYAQMSPVFNSMHATILKQTSGTNGDFCIRCHTQVGMQREEKLFTSNLKRHPASIEGITCVVCHRVDRNYGKVSGRTAIVEGDLLQPGLRTEGQCHPRGRDQGQGQIQDPGQGHRWPAPGARGGEEVRSDRDFGVLRQLP